MKKNTKCICIVLAVLAALYFMIRSYGAQESMEHSYRQKLADNFRTRGKVNFYDSTYSPLIQMVRAQSDEDYHVEGEF